MTILIGLFILACSIWVLFDAHGKGAKNPAGWAVFVAVTWIVGMPYYLYQRNKFVQIDPANAPSVSNRWIGLAVVMVLIGGWTTYTVREESAPACDDPEVLIMLSNLLNGSKVDFPAQRPESREFGAIRKCNATVGERIQPYRVSWYSDDKERFIVQLE